MSQARKPSSRSCRDDLRTECKFDFPKSRPNRFASRIGRDAVAVVLEPDVARVFDSSKSWAEIHKGELQQDWGLLQSGQPPVKIDPLR